MHDRAVEMQAPGRQKRRGGLLRSLLCALAFLLVLPVAQAQPAPATDAGSVARTLSERTYSGDLPAIRKRRILRALVTFSRTDFFFEADGTPRGLQVEYLREYQKALNKGVKREVDKLSIRYIPTTFDRLIPDLLAWRGDVAAALLTVTPERQKKVAFASGQVMQVAELVVANKRVAGIKRVEDLAGRELYVLKGSSYVEHLRELSRQFTARGLKPIRIKEADNHLLSEDILELVNAGVVDMTVVDDYKARLWAKVLPDIRVLDSVVIKADNRVGWALRKGSPHLQKSLDDFARQVKKGTLMGNILFNRYYKDNQWIANPWSDSERRKLKKFLTLFKDYGEKYGFDYLAVAAQAYQESRLDNSKRSPSGAIGLMQLLPSTAADPNVGIPDIKPVENNVHAGVKYLAFLRDRYFNDPAISEENRFALSWAAYNAGPAKVRSMRRKAADMGLDANVWFANVELAAGKLVGRETVQYVGNIFKYYVAYSLAQERIAGIIEGSAK